MGKKLEFSFVWMAREIKKERKVDRKITWVSPKKFSLQTWREDQREMVLYSSFQIQSPASLTYLQNCPYSVLIENCNL